METRDPRIFASHYWICSGPNGTAAAAIIAVFGGACHWSCPDPSGECPGRRLEKFNPVEVSPDSMSPHVNLQHPGVCPICRKPAVLCGDWAAYAGGSPRVFKSLQAENDVRHNGDKLEEELALAIFGKWFTGTNPRMGVDISRLRYRR
jgi:hypothetical protein